MKHTFTDVRYENLVEIRILETIIVKCIVINVKCSMKVYNIVIERNLCHYTAG